MDRVLSLEKVLSSGVFKSADRLRDLLRFAVYETLEGRGDELKEYVLGATTLGRGDSFDPKTDPIVRVQMRRLREHLHLYYSTEGRSQAVVIEIPKGTYAPTLRVAAPEAVPLPARLSEERFMVAAIQNSPRCPRSRPPPLDTADYFCSRASPALARRRWSRRF